MTIRRATPADLDLIQRLESATFPDAWARVSLENALRESGYLVLLAQECGYLLGWHVGDEAELARLGVLAAQRGQGVGTALVLAALDEWKNQGVQSVFLEVRASNAAAIRVYKRVGFEEVGRRKRYYLDGEDALVLRQTLA